MPTSIEDDAVVQDPLGVGQELASGAVATTRHPLTNDSQVHGVEDILPILLLEVVTDIRLKEISLLPWKQVNI